MAISAAVVPAHAALRAKTVVTATWPAAFAFDGRGHIYYGHRFTGEIRVFDLGTREDRSFATLPNIVTAGEQGLLGLAVHPSYPSSPYVYAYYTRSTGAAQNAIVRLTDSAGAGTDLTTIWSRAAASFHNGGVIHFGPDGRLYAVVGDAGSRANAQNLGSDAGKLLRMTAKGGRPSGNPFPGSRVWAYGIRNSFGFAFDPQTGNVFETENGPECNDEVNPVPGGGNLAWGPSATCMGAAPGNTNQDGPEPRTLPHLFYTPTIAPTGAAFCQSCGLGPNVEGRLLFGDWNEGDIHAATLTPDRLGIASETVVLDRSSGILAVERGPNGRVYFSDPNGIYRLAGNL